MKRFRFSLEALLEHRRRLEEARQRELAAELSALSRLQGQLDAIADAVREEAAALRDGQLVGRVDVSLLTAHRRFVLACERQRGALLEHMAAARGRVERARALLVEAARARKVVERLKERRYTQWKAEVLKAEQAETDDATSALGVYRMLRGRADGSEGAGASEVGSGLGAAGLAERS
ncbi:MAG: flagellar export protein FliJ [Tepidisphaerales bacterium]